MTGNGRALGGSFARGLRRVRRAESGAMRLTGDEVFGPPRDRGEALRVRHEALEARRPHERHLQQKALDMPRAISDVAG